MFTTLRAQSVYHVILTLSIYVNSHIFVVDSDSVLLLFWMCQSMIQRPSKLCPPVLPPFGVFAQAREWWAPAFRLNPWAKGCADRDYYLFVMVDVISCRYRMEGLWFIALSTATSRTCALACRMNTTLSGLSIRHHHHSAPQPPSQSLPIPATAHKQCFIILICFLYFFSYITFGKYLKVVANDLNSS